MDDRAEYDERAEYLADMFEVDQRLYDEQAYTVADMFEISDWLVDVDKALVDACGLGLDDLGLRTVAYVHIYRTIRAKGSYL